MNDLENLHRNMAVEEILKERMSQVKKWGQQDHHPLLWLAILGEEVGEVCQSILNLMHTDNPVTNHLALTELEDELVQVAAVAVAFLESLYADKWKHGVIANGSFG